MKTMMRMRMSAILMTFASLEKGRRLVQTGFLRLV
jgi:hypothetical protein